MKVVALGTRILIASAFALAGCSGNFGSGGGGGITPPAGPVNQTVPGSPAPSPGTTPATSPTGDTATYPFSQAPTGMQCPTVAGFSCLLKFNAPAPTPTPTATPKGRHPAGKSKLKSKPSASPTPSPSPSPSPSPTTLLATSAPGATGTAPSPGASASASPTPAGANVTFQLDALPKDAPAMVNPDPKAFATTALLALRMKADGTILLDGTAIADFTLPKDQLGGRSYAIQLFQETTHRKKRDDKFVGTFSDSTLDGSTLRFVFTPPKLQIKKDEVWLFVLYGGETPGASPAPGARGSAAPGSPSAVPSPSPTPTQEP